MNHDSFVTEWVVNTVKEKYADDIALVAAHSTLNIDPDSPCMSFFVPITARGRQFARTFILDGRGYDIWGIEWDRLQKFADLEEYNLTVLADSRLLYARTPEDAARFEDLRQQLLRNLSDPETSRKQALIAYATAKGLYTQLLFAQGSDIRVYAGYVLDYLSRAIAFHNRSYFRRSQMCQPEELSAMAQVPDGFIARYPEVIRTGNVEYRKQLCHDLICLVRDFLSADSQPHPERNFQDLADWYAELSYTWLRIRRYAELGDPLKVHMWGILLQNELNAVCEDFGLEKMELMQFYDAADLPRFAARADTLEDQIRSVILEHGGVIREYPTAEDFLHEV